MLDRRHIVHLLDRSVDRLLDQQLQPVAYAGCRLPTLADIVWPVEDALDDRKKSGPLENRPRETEGFDEHRNFLLVRELHSSGVDTRVPR